MSWASFDGLSKVCDEDCSHTPNKKHCQEQQQNQPTEVDAVDVLWGGMGEEGVLVETRDEMNDGSCACVQLLW